MADRVRLFAISTCGWCKRAKRFMESNKVEYEAIDIDMLEGEEKELARAEVAKYNPRRSYPTLVVDEEVVVGFDEDRIKELLDL
jgi:glutaredoxin-like protein NrdH